MTVNLPADHPAARRALEQAGTQAKAPKKRQPKAEQGFGSDGERAFFEWCKRLELPEPTPQYQIGGRGHRYDFGWHEARIVVEVNGGVGDPRQAHSTHAGVSRDYRFIAQAAAAGYRILLATTEQAVSGEAAIWAGEALAWRQKPVQRATESKKGVGQNGVDKR